MNKSVFCDDHMSLFITMLEFVRAAVLMRNPVIPRGVAIDWDKLMDLSSEQGLLAWVWDGVSKLPLEEQPPRQQRINWGLSVQEITDAYEHQKSVLKEIVKICEQNDIRVLLLKGICLSEMYPKPELRPSGDIDFYLFGSYQKGNELLSGGRYEETAKRAGFNYKGVHLENHNLFLTPDTAINIKVDSFLKENCHKSFSTPNGYFVFDPINELVFQAMHIVAHLKDFNNGPSLRMIIDFGITLRHYSQSIVPNQLKSQLSRLNILPLFCLFMYTSERILGTKYSEFHWVGIPSKCVSAVLQLALMREVNATPISEKPFADRICIYFRRSSSMKKLWKYLPISKWRYLQIIIRIETSSIIRSFRGIISKK